MNSWAVGFVVGMVIGVPAGYFIAALMFIAAREDGDK